MWSRNQKNTSRQRAAQMSCVAICLLILAGLWIVGYNLITVEKPSKVLPSRDMDEWVPIPTIGNRIHSMYQTHWCRKGIHSDYLNPDRASRRPEPDHAAVTAELRRFGFLPPEPEPASDACLAKNTTHQKGKSTWQSP